MNKNLNVNIIMQLGISWQHSYAKGIWYYLHYIKRHYNDPIIYVTENGTIYCFKDELQIIEIQ